MNYLSSPFNLLLILFSKAHLLKGISFVIGLKAVFAASTMSFYLKTKFKDNNVFFIPISILYGFSAYFRSYYWNLMWLDGMIWLPIIVLGIENIVNHKKYIGQSKNISDRWRRHIYALNLGTHENDYLQKSKTRCQKK